MNRRLSFVLILGIGLLAIFVPIIAHAQDTPPPPPHAFWGDVKVNCQDAAAGTVVEARGDNVLTGGGDVGNPITVTVAGKYGGPTLNEGKLLAQGMLKDDQPIEFYVDGAKAQVQKAGEDAWRDSYPFQQLVVTHLNLRVGVCAQAQASPTATATSSQVVSGQAPVAEPTQGPAPTATRQGPASTSTAPATTATVPPNQTTQPLQATTLPGAVVTNPTEAAVPVGASPAATVATSPAAQPTQAVQATPTLANTQAPTVEAAGVAPSATPARVAAVPNATARPILGENKPPEAVQSTLSETAEGGSGRRIAFWGGLGLLLIAVAIGAFVKMRGLPR